MRWQQTEHNYINKLLSFRFRIKEAILKQNLKLASVLEHEMTNFVFESANRLERRLINMGFGVLPKPHN